MSLSDEIGTMVWAFDDEGRKQLVRDIAARVEALEKNPPAWNEAVDACIGRVQGAMQDPAPNGLAQWKRLLDVMRELKR